MTAEQHKLEGMVWDEHPTPCQHPGCGEENPEYFLWEFEPGESHGMFCLHHALRASDASGYEG